MSNTDPVIFNMLVYQFWIKYYENVCQKIKPGKSFSFSILTDQKNFPRLSQAGKWQNNFPYFKNAWEPWIYIPQEKNIVFNNLENFHFSEF